MEVEHRTQASLRNGLASLTQLGPDSMRTQPGSRSGLAFPAFNSALLFFQFLSYFLRHLKSFFGAYTLLSQTRVYRTFQVFFSLWTKGNTLDRG